MMAPVNRILDEGADPVHGQVKLDYGKCLWNGSMILSSIIFIPLLFDLLHLAIFVAFTWLTLLIGHSVGMHRMMIHRSFDAQPWLKKLFIYIGVLVGMGGPSSIIATHDLRDWAQRQPNAHDYFTHKRGFWRDLSWQLFYRFELAHPPQLKIEAEFAQSPYYRLLDKSWRWHQILVAVPSFMIGGWSAVTWLVPLRIIVSVGGHWTITYFCHNPGPGRWRVKDAGVQASNLPGLGMLTFGECWHNNHHAFPESARVGLEPGQPDPAAWVIERLESYGLVHNVGTPRADELRDDLYLTN